MRLPVHKVFINFKHAYDTVKREKVYEAIEKVGNIKQKHCSDKNDLEKDRL